MQIAWLDIGLLAFMGISGLLAMMRGFTREVLSVLAWVAALVAGLVAIFVPELVSWAKDAIPGNNETVAKIAVAVVVFLVVLIIMSLISVKIADLILDSAAGAIDRTLGLIYGLLRGLIVVAVLYFFASWALPDFKSHDHVRTAKSLPFIEKTNEIIVQTISSLPFVQPEFSENLQQILKSSRRENNNANNPQNNDNSQNNEQPQEQNYQNNQKRQLDQLIESGQNEQ